jgi:chromosome segregation ATPase
MPLKEIKKNMGELSERLSEISADTSKLEKAIETAREDIESYTPDAMNDFAAFLKSETEALEAEHPELTDFINRIMVTLSNIGI